LLLKLDHAAREGFAVQVVARKVPPQRDGRSVNQLFVESGM
jgi:hypothetical protein